uniref:Uncharacterized protein n=1 Tax=Myoviridae sp. ctPuP5 TaxID=2823543 RepID=A0A8S5L9W2_9CAUD|nr:MAG TPA: hypothetical protein [Myoviridae sp. ctPuP5]
MINCKCACHVCFNTLIIIIKVFSKIHLYT